MAQKIARFKTISLLQGGADAFVEGELDTGIIPENGEAWLINRIEMQFPAILSGISADSNIDWSITRDSKASVVGFSDPDTVYYDGFVNALTTSGQVIIPTLRTYTPEAGTIFVEPTIFAQLDSATTGLTMQCYMRIYYELVKVTEIEILRLLNSN
jgi:hypothetical protein